MYFYSCAYYFRIDGYVLIQDFTMSKVSSNPHQMVENREILMQNIYDYLFFTKEDFT